MSEQHVGLDREAPLRIVSPTRLAWNDRIIDRCYPGLGPAVRAYLSVFGAMALRGRTKPLSLIFETTSGFGKTAVLQMAFPEARPEMTKYVYRSDSFTPKSFVSHAANVTSSELEKIDMLPKLRDKVLITKELAPIFRGREDDLTSNFSMLISVLDGKGFRSNSGARGERGYEGSVVFNWVGATTQIPAETHRLMAQLGTRFLFYEVPAKRPTDDDLLAYLTDGNAWDAEDKCNQTVNNFLCEFFERSPVGSLDPNEIDFPTSFKLELVRLAKLLTAARAKLRYERIGGEYEAVSAEPAEGPWRVLLSLRELAFGHALISGHTKITRRDLNLVREVTLSSIPGHLRPIVRALLVEEYVDTCMCGNLCGVSHPTARKRLFELELLGIGRLRSGSSTSNESHRIMLAEEYSWLRENLESETEVGVVH